jgi:AraC family transcriptional regulator
MKNRNLIYQSVRLIEANLRGDLTVNALAREYGFSIYYFSRLFKGVTGFTPKAYMLHRKLSESVKDLLATEKKIIEIAFDFGFTTPESFTRAFHKLMGLNPSDVRKQKKFDKCKLLLPVTKEKLENMQEMPRQEPEALEFGPLYLVGIPFYYEMLWKEDLLNPWERFTANISLIPDRIVPEKYYQVQYWFKDQDQGSIFFFIALEVTRIREIPIQFTAKILPRQKYLKFLHHGYSNKVGFTYKYIYEIWLPDSHYKLPYLFNFEYYGDEHKGPYNEESVSEIYIPVDE